MRFIDLSHTISHGIPVFPGEERPSIIRDPLPDDAGYVTHRLESNMHTGTHIDAPFHILSDLLTIDKYPLEMFSGNAAVINVKGLSSIAMQQEWEPVFRQHKIVLFYSGHSKLWGDEKYYTEYPDYDAEIAKQLVKYGVTIAGFDSPSPDKSPFEFHDIFLRSKRFLVENLTNLEMLAGMEKITFMALPLKIKAEASLVRAIALIDQV